MRGVDNIYPFPDRRQVEPGTVELTVVIPVYNEVESIRRVAHEVARTFERHATPFELLFVDDGSNDGTHDALMSLGVDDARVRSLRHANRAGQSAALRTGVLHARAPLVAVLDGDGQNDPADLPQMIAKFQQLDEETHGSAGMMIGERIDRRDGWSKRIASRIANRVRRMVLRDGIRDSGCGIKVFRRSAFLELPSIDHMHRFLPALFLSAGYEVQAMPVHHRERISGESKYGIRDRMIAGIVDLIGIAWLTRRRGINVRPLAMSRDVDSDSGADT